jgi:salicylate hydroxylase
VKVVPEGAWREFAMFAGPRLDRIIGWDNKVALIGDASHPLSGEIFLLKKYCQAYGILIII